MYKRHVLFGCFLQHLLKEDQEQGMLIQHMSDRIEQMETDIRAWRETILADLLHQATAAAAATSAGEDTKEDLAAPSAFAAAATAAAPPAAGVAALGGATVRAPQCSVGYT